jgi:hypothetical protein
LQICNRQSSDPAPPPDVRRITKYTGYIGSDQRACNEILEIVNAGSENELGKNGIGYAACAQLRDKLTLC